MDKRMHLENYKAVLQCVLAKNKVSNDEKKMMRQYRNNNNISYEEHVQVLQQFG